MPNLPTTCTSGRCTNKSWRPDGLCAKHAKCAGKLRPNVTTATAQHALAALRAEGWTLAQISRSTGISTAGLKLIPKRDPEAPTKATTYEALKDLIGTQPNNEGKLPAWPYNRRLQALQAAGYTGRQLADLTGLSYGQISRLSLNVTQQTNWYVADKILTLWEEVAHNPIIGPATPTARRRLWEPPLAWEDIDDPDEHHPKPVTHITVSPYEREKAIRMIEHYPPRHWPDDAPGRDTITEIARGKRRKAATKTLDYLYLQISKLDTIQRPRPERKTA